MESDEYMRTYEALSWLENNNNPSAFSSNRFRKTDSAIAFIRDLYACGAAEVLISNIMDEPWRIEEEGGPYADVLIVKLPADHAQQENLIKLYQKECRDYFCNEGIEEAGQRGETLTFWWD